MPFKSRIRRLFTEASMLMGITPKTIQQTTNNLLGAIRESFDKGDSTSIISHYANTDGSEFAKLLKQFLDEITKVIHIRSDDYEVSVPEATVSYLKRLQFDMEDYIEKSLEYDENFFNMFDESSLVDFIEGFDDSIEEQEYYRALFFLACYMLKRRTDKDIMGGSSRD